LCLHFVSFVPENEAKHKTNDNRHEEPNGVKPGVPPVGPVLFAEASMALSQEALGVLGGEVKVF